MKGNIMKTHIEAEIDSPMKSAEDWACYYLGLDAPPSNKGMGFQTMVSFIERVQSDAIASKLPNVGLLKLAEDAALDIDQQVVLCSDDIDMAIDIIYTALLKARGEK